MRLYVFCQRTCKYLTNGSFIIISPGETSSSHGIFNAWILELVQKGHMLTVKDGHPCAMVETSTGV